MKRRFPPALKGHLSSSSGFVPATGLGIFLRWYDPAVGLLTSHRRLLNRICEHVPAQGHVLDVGCGSGSLAVRLAAEKQRQVAAIDIDERILAQAKAKPGQESVQWCCGSSIKLPFEDAQFDCVVCCLLSHHLTNDEKEKTFREIYRVLSPTGLFVFADFASPKNLLSRLAFLSVRVVDGWERTKTNADGRVLQQLNEVFPMAEEVASLQALLGTVRVYRSEKNLPPT